MDRIEVMQQAGSGMSVKFTEVTRAYSKDKSQLICIFEGEDEKYFCARINQALNDRKWHPINTGGKAVVLELFDTISNHPDYKTIDYKCFVDHDFEDWYQNPEPRKIYITPCYSIENLYVSESVFKRVMSAEFNVNEHAGDGSDYAQCIAFFRQRLEEYLNHVQTFNHWIKAQRIMVRDHKSNKKLNIRNIKLKSLVETDINSVTIKYDPTDSTTIFSGDQALTIDTTSLIEAQNTLPVSQGAVKFRGKQNIEFLRSLLTILKTDRTSDNPNIFSTRGNVRLQLSKDNIISELSQYAETPRCLVNFLS